MVTGYEFVPDQTEFVHHALVYRMSADQRDERRAGRRRRPGTGYECFGGIGARRGACPAGTGRARSTELVAGWAPGQRPGESIPTGAGLQMEPGDFFVTQIHYHYVHAAPPDQ